MQMITALGLALGLCLGVAGCGPDRPEVDDPRNEWEEHCASRENCGQCAADARCGYCNREGDGRCVYYSQDDESALASCGEANFARITEDCEAIGVTPDAP